VYDTLLVITLTMMKSIFLYLSILVAASAFAPISLKNARTSALNLAVLPPPLNVNAQQPTAAIQSSSMVLQDGIQNFMSASNPIESSTLSLSLKERPPPPTAEEIAQKKATFNFWFWGGGIVAPFIATVFYFGPKFWEK
jgi:hypothetical protein